MSDTARNAEILRRRLAGETFKEIGVAYGISATRVRDILNQVVERATTTEEERRAKRAEAKRRRAEEVARSRAEQERRRAELEEQRRRDTLVYQLRAVVPSWSSLNNFGWWLREHSGRFQVHPHDPRVGTAGRVMARLMFGGGSPPPDPPNFPEFEPTFRAADWAVAQWLDGRANETMTVLRLRRLTEVA